ncbi:hypothetical protein TWF281_011315 [Arthrobotrys megalospora]
MQIPTATDQSNYFSPKLLFSSILNFGNLPFYADSSQVHQEEQETMPIKYEESEDTFANLTIEESETHALDNNDENNDHNPQLPTPPTSPKPAAKKRRRSGGSVDHIAKVKSEHTTESTEQTPPAPPKKEPKPKKQTTPSSGAPKRGRPSGGSTAFTAEQDAYLIHLRQNSSNAEEIWIAFEKKFHTGKNQKALCNRWFGIKDSVLLSGDDDKLLMETIEEVMGDVAANCREVQGEEWEEGYEGVCSKEDEGGEKDGEGRGREGGR